MTVMANSQFSLKESLQTFKNHLTNDHQICLFWHSFGISIKDEELLSSVTLCTKIADVKETDKGTNNDPQNTT
jgi:hypothetical protein